MNKPIAFSILNQHKNLIEWVKDKAPEIFVVYKRAFNETMYFINGKGLNYFEPNYYFRSIEQSLEHDWKVLYEARVDDGYCSVSVPLKYFFESDPYEAVRQYLFNIDWSDKSYLEKLEKDEQGKWRIKDAVP